MYPITTYGCHLANRIEQSVLACSLGSLYNKYIPAACFYLIDFVVCLIGIGHFVCSVSYRLFCTLEICVGVDLQLLDWSDRFPRCCVPHTVTNSFKTHTPFVAIFQAGIG